MKGLQEAPLTMFIGILDSVHPPVHIYALVHRYINTLKTYLTA